MDMTQERFNIDNQTNPRGRIRGTELEEAQYMAHFFHSELYLTHLLLGGHYDESRIVLEMPGDDDNIDMRGVGYIVICAEIEKWEGVLAENQVKLESETRYDLDYAMKNLCREQFMIEGVKGAWGVNLRGRFYFILPLEREIDRPLLLQKVEETVEILEDKCDIYASFAVSESVDSFSNIHQAAELADLLHEQRRFLAKPERVMTLKGQYRGTLDLFGRIKLENDLLSAVNSLDTGKMQLIIAEAASVIFKKDPPDAVHFSVCRQYFTELVAETLEIAWQVFPRGNEMDRGFITGEETLEELLEFFDDRCQELRGEHLPLGEVPKWVYDMREYVQLNSSNPDMNVNYLADRWGMGSSYCTKVFRSAVGMGLYEYIQRCRVRHAKSLLSEGLNLKTVAQCAGFPSPIAMNRAFSRYEGATPRDLLELTINE